VRTTATSRTGNGPANLATIRAAVIAAIKDAGYLHIPEGRRDHTTPPKPFASTVSNSGALSLNSTIAFRGLGRPGRVSFDRLSDPPWRSGSRRATIEP
jgi:hypothetical protein